MYHLPGISEVSDGRTIFTWIRDVVSVTQWEKEVDAFFRSIPDCANKKKYATRIGLEDLLQMETPSHPINSTVARAMQHLVTRWFKSMGLIDAYPVVLQYRRTPYMTFDDALDNIMAKHIVWPTMSMLGGERAQVHDLIVAFREFLRKHAHRLMLRRKYALDIRTAIQHRGYMLQVGQPLDAREQSAYLALMNPNTFSGRCRMLDTNLAGAWVPSAPLVPTENQNVGSSSSEDSFRLLLDSVEPGPFSRFGRMMSNGKLQELFAVYLPYVPTLEFSTGFFEPLGNFARIRLETSEKVEWNADVQYEAYRIHQTGYAPSAMRPLELYNPPAMLNTPSSFGGSYPDMFETGAAAFGAMSALERRRLYTYEYSLDNERVEIRMPGGRTAMCHEVAFDWRSSIRGDMVVSTGAPHYAHPEVLYQEIAATSTSYGDGTVGGLTCTNYGMIDLHASMYHGLANKILQITPGGTDYLEEYRIYGATGTGPAPTAFSIWSMPSRDVNIDVTNLYVAEGEVRFRPAFCEYVAPDMSFLEVERPREEDQIMARLGLRPSQRLLNKRSVRMHHNFYVWRRQFGYDMFPITELRRRIEMMTSTPFGI